MSILRSPAHSNEIAQRRLHALGLIARPGADGSSLETTLQARVRDPLSGKALGPIRFVIDGRDLRPVDPPAVDGLAPLPFLDLRGPDALVQELEQLLQKRLLAAQAAMNEMRRLRLAVQIHPQRLRAVGRLELTSLGTVIVEGDERGVRATALEPLRGGRGAVPMNEPVDLREHQHRVDLELQLFAPAEKALATPAAARPAPRAAVTPVAGQAAGGVTLAQLVEKFGADARVEPGLVLSRTLQIGGRDLRFTARWEKGAGFSGTLRGGDETLWEGAFDLESLGRVEELAAARIGVAPPPALSVTLGPAASLTGEMLDGHLRPVAGEVWLMSILVASEANGAVRYVPVDIDGKPFGEPRTLSRADFDATFERAGSGGHRLLAKVLQVSESHVTWVQLDPQRVPVGKPKNGALGVFVNHFVPAAAAY